MSGRGVLFALDRADEAAMLARRDARQRVSCVANDIEERWDVRWLHQMDDLWFPVHYCLHGSVEFPLPGAPSEAKAIFGGDPLGIPRLFSIDYKNGALTRAIASALAKMREEAIWARAGLIERKEFEGSKGEEMQTRVVYAVHDLRDFYLKAAEAQRAVIFTVDL